MAAAGVAGLLRAAFLSVGGAARRWGLLAGPRAVPGPGGSAGAPRTQSASAPARSSSEDKITVHFVNRDGETLTAKGKVGDSLLDVVIENNLDIDGFDFIHDRKRQRYRQREKQAPRKEPDAGLNPGSPGSRAEGWS